jgi:predicted nucleic acid-binding Zn finger protein
MDEALAVLLNRERGLTPSVRDGILQCCGERGRKALKAIDENRIKKYRDFFVVVGSSNEYIVDEDFCTCQDFVFRGGRCWHILAVEIAERVGVYEEIDAWYLDNWEQGSVP